MAKQESNEIRRMRRHAVGLGSANYSMFSRLELDATHWIFGQKAIERPKPIARNAQAIHRAAQPQPNRGDGLDDSGDSGSCFF